MRDGIRWDADTDLHLLKRFFIPQDNFGNNLGRRAMKAIAFRLHVLEMLRHQLHEAIVI